MQNNKSCKGVLYNISGKNYCVKERKTRTKTRTRTKKTKTTRRIKRYLKKNRTKTRTRNTKMRTNKGRGPEPHCCMCGTLVDKDKSLLPSECKIKHGTRAHRICEECWFDPVTGFALEGRSHKCPGCEKGLPLTHVKQKTPEMVDLTLDSD